MLETAVALSIVKPLVGVVFSGIVGGAAQAKFKKLWDLPREGVDDLEFVNASGHASSALVGGKSQR